MARRSGTCSGVWDGGRKPHHRRDRARSYCRGQPGFASGKTPGTARALDLRNSYPRHIGRLLCGPHFGPGGTGGRTTMISRLSAIAFNTFREAVRDRVLYILVLFVLLLVATAPLFGQISIGLERIILINVGLSAMSLFGIVIAIFVGIGLVSKEIEKKTLYTILSRPVR